MKKLSFLLLFSLVTFGLFAQASDDRLKELGEKMKKEGTGWIRGGGIGFDLSGLGLINPRVGAGINQFGVGGIGTFFADKKLEKRYWDNSASIQLGMLRQGGKDQPFLKNMDVLRLTSKAGFSVSKNNKWYATTLGIFQSSLLKTYAGNFLSDGNNTRSLFSQLFAPAQLQLHPGIEWKPNAHFSALFSPIGLNAIFVANDDIAALNVHGNEVGKNNRIQMVPSIQLGYKNKFLNDRVSYASSLNWTTDYLNNPFNVSALNFWQNNLSFNIYKGLSLDLFGEAQYDHNKFVQKDIDGDGQYNVGTVAPVDPLTFVDGRDIPATPDTADRLGRGVQWAGTFMLRYNHIF